MEKYLKSGIKSIIDSFPEVGRILEKHGIGCVPCTVGTCKLEDVVKIHALSPQAQAIMMGEVERAIYPDRKRVLPAVEAGPEETAPRAFRYSPPLKMLVDEHTWIKRLLALIPAMAADMQHSGKIDPDLVTQVVDFIRNYADRFHHQKEEDILFEYTDKNSDIIKVIYEDHDRGRAFVRAALEAQKVGDAASLARNLQNYAQLLTEHIKKEDEVLYPFIDRSLSTRQVGELFSRFAEVDRQTGIDVSQKYQDLIVTLETRFSSGSTQSQAGENQHECLTSLATSS